MQEWIAAQLTTGLPAFAGSKLSGTISVKQEAVNELIAKWLAGNSAPSPPPQVDLRVLRAAIKSATVRAETGRLLIDIEISL
jgi:hypothetical protein